MLWGPQGSRETGEGLLLRSSIEAVVTRRRVAGRGPKEWAEGWPPGDRSCWAGLGGEG